MPYIYNADGTVIFVPENEQKEAPSAPSPSETTSTAVKEAPTEEKKEDKDSAKNKEFEEKYLKGFKPSPKPERVERGPQEKAHGGILGGPLPDVDRPSWKEETKKEWENLKRFPGEFSAGVKRVIPAGFIKGIFNDPVAVTEIGGAYKFKQESQQVGAVLNFWDAILGTKMGETYQEKADKAIDPYLKSLEETGTDPQGLRPGYKPYYPGGSLLSQDGSLYKKWFTPKHGGEEFLQNLTALIGLDSLVTGALKASIKAPSVLARTPKSADHLRQFFGAVAQKKWKTGLKEFNAFTLKELLPDALQSLTAFRPSPPDVLEERRHWVHSLPPDQAEYAWNAIRADTPTEFDYWNEQLTEIGYGWLGIAAIRTTLLGARYSYKFAQAEIRKGKTPDIDKISAKGANQAVTEEAGNIERGISEEVLAEQERLIGNVNRQIEVKVDKAGREVADGLKRAAANYNEIRAKNAEEIERITKEIDAVPDSSKDVQLLEMEIESIKKDYGVETDSDVDELLERLGKDWEKYEFEGKPNKLNRVIDQVSDLAYLRDYQAQLDEALQNVQLRASKGLEIENLVLKDANSGLGIHNSLNDARVLLRKLNELLEEREGYLKARNTQLFNEGKLESTDYNYNYPGPFGEAYSELTDLVNTGEAAQASGNLNDEFVKNIVARSNEIHQKIVDAGGVAEVIPEGTAAKAAQVEEPKAPKKGEEVVEDPTKDNVKYEAPVKPDADGKLVIDNEQIAARQALQPKNATKAIDLADETKAVNKDLDIHQNPKDEGVTPEQFWEDKERILAERNEAEKIDIENGTNKAEQVFNVRGTNSGKWTVLNEQKAVIAGQFRRRGPRTDRRPAAYASAIRQMGSWLGGPEEVMAARKLAAWTEAGNFGDEIADQFDKIIYTMSSIQDATSSVMRAVRDVRQVNAGISVLGKSRALKNFKDRYMEFSTLMRAVDKQMYGIGNALRLLGPSGRIKATALSELGSAVPGAKTQSWQDPANFKVALSNRNGDGVIDELKKLGDWEEFVDELNKKVRQANDELEREVGDFMRKFDEGTATKKDIDGMENLIEKMVEAKGDPLKIRDVGMTQQAVMANVHTGHVLSSWSLPFSIPVMGSAGMAARLSARWGMHNFHGNFQRLLVKRGLGSAEEMERQFRAARLSRRTMQYWFKYWGQGLESAKNAFLFNRSISDPIQARRSDLSLSASGMSREEAVLQALKGNQEHNQAWTKWLLDRYKDDPDMIKHINEAVTLGKVFHDYLIPGEAWNLRGIWRKIAGWPTELARKVPSPGEGTTKLGTTSYFPSGERVNMSIWSQFASIGDEWVTASWASASVHARAVEKVDDMIANGLLDVSNRAKAIDKALEDDFAEFFQPVKAGFDQEYIGSSILDEQALELTRLANQTAELTGPLGSIRSAVELLRNDSNPYVSFTARFIFPIINSPLVAVKQAAAFAYGGELARFATSMGRAGLRKTVEQSPIIKQFVEGLDPAIKKHIIDFESQYFSKDTAVRDRAWNAFALAAGIQASVAGIVWTNSNITGGLDETYKSAEGRAERFRMLVGDVSVPYRYFPLVGDAIAIQTTIRDMVLFNPDLDVWPLMSITTAAAASTILDLPGLTGVSQGLDTLKKATRGDTDALIKYVGSAYTRLGSPYLNARKDFIQSFDRAKPAAKDDRFTRGTAFKKGKFWEKESDVNLFKETALGAIDLGLGAISEAHEYDLAIIADWLVEVITGDDQYRESTRRAVPYGKPGELVKASSWPFWQPIQAILGRYWFGNNDLTDPVNNAILINLIDPVNTNLYNSYQGKRIGISINDTEVNQFNHFFNNEYRFTVNGKEYLGINAYIRDIVKDKDYKKYDQLDSPYKIGGSPGVQSLLAPGGTTKANWDRMANERRMILRSAIKAQVEKAKIQFLRGNLEGQRYKASEETKNLVLEAYNGGLN